jgi:TonB-dependent receptor-like protein
LSFQLEAYDQAEPSTHFGLQPATYNPGTHVERPGYWGGITRRRDRGVGGLVALRLGRFELDAGANVDDQYDPFEYDSDFADPRIRTIHTRGYGDLRHYADLGRRAQLKSRGYVDGGNWNATWIYSDPGWCAGLPTTCRNTEHIRDSRAGAEEQVTVDWLLNGRVVTLVGADGRANWLSDRVGLTEIATGRQPDYRLLHTNRVRGAGAVYISQSWRPVDRVALDAGLRFDVDQTFGWHFSPRGALTVVPWRLANIKLLYAEAFRAPGIGELEYHDPQSYLKADGLRPEIVRSLELAGEQRFPGGRGSIRLGAFYSWWRDLIGLGPISQQRFDTAIAGGELNPDADYAYVVQYQNRDRIQSFGGFAALQAHTVDRHVQFGLNAGVAQAMERLGGQLQRPLALYPSVTGNARLAWVPRDPIPSFGIAAFYASPRRTFDDVNGQFSDPRRAPNAFSYRFTIDGAIPGTYGLRYSLTIDHNLARQAPYFVGPNRSSDSSGWRGELYPIRQLSVIAALRYDFSLAAAKQRRKARG